MLRLKGGQWPFEGEGRQIPAKGGHQEYQGLVLGGLQPLPLCTPTKVENGNNMARNSGLPKSLKIVWVMRETSSGPSTVIQLPSFGPKTSLPKGIMLILHENIRGVKIYRKHMSD